MGVKNNNTDIGVRTQQVLSVKMLKLVNDPCFGKKYEQHCQCEQCWIKPSCLVCFRNRK
ncbi:MAG: hypothetical protein QW666_00085 [Candidatus Woesearchaeota archaeon]